MSRQEILEEIMALKEQLNNLEKMYDSLTPLNKRWRAETGDTFYYITATGLTEGKIEVGLDVDNSRYEFGNYFQTREQAEFEAERLKVTAELREWTTPISEFKWDGYSARKYTLEIRGTGENIHLTVALYYCSGIQTSDLCFESEEVAKRAIESIGEDRIIKYLFRRSDIKCRQR